jgi:GNAT superfamily N-acetyltransferase
MVQAACMQSLAIRSATPDDVVAVRDLYRRSSLSNDGDRASLLAHPDALDFADLSVLEGRTRVAVDGERIVGFATMRLTGALAELDDLFVDPAWMRRGIGRRLIIDATMVARSDGITRIDVTANPHALDFYTAVGFVLDGVIETQFGTGHRMHLDVIADNSRAR